MSTGPQNVVMGEQDLPLEVPQTQVPEAELTDEKKMARYSKSAEFKRLREFMEARIQYFQKFFPSGQRVQDLPAEERNAYWQAACIVVTEFENILAEYDRAHGAVRDAERQS